MPDFSVLACSALFGLATTFVIAVLTWILSVAKHDVSIVDSAWSVLILGAAVTYACTLAVPGPRAVLVLGLVTAWAVRLALYITWRNWGEPEDHRYQAIRKRNEPRFALKSLYLVFGLQAVLAWIVSFVLLAAVASDNALGPLDVIGAAIFLFGLAFETIGDLQLARFKADAGNRGRVMDTGLWRYTRHPNYFGEFCVWWGAYLIALAAGGIWAIWTIVSPLLMSVLLMKVSGVALLEKDIGERRPKYRDYIERTNAFFPGMPRSAGTR